MDLSGSCDLPLLVGGTINIKSLERQDGSGQEKKTSDEGGVDKVSSGPAINKGCGDNSSHSVL